MKDKFLKVATVLLFSAFLLSMFLYPAVRPVEAGPLAAITPVVVYGAGGDNFKVTFFDGNVTADTRQCFDLSVYKVVDLQYIIDQGTVNTTTLKLQWSNQGMATTSNYEDEATLVSANVADAHAGNQYRLSGTFNCVFADVSNANPLSLKVYGVAKK